MKKNKFLGITASICALSAAITPLATMSSCGNKEEDKQIPVDKLWITHDGILSGMDPTLDLSQYTTLVIPDKVVEIAPEAFRGYFAPHSGKQCNVNRIVFDKNLRRIGAQAFAGCQTLTDLDFVALTPMSWLTMEKTDAFDGMVGYGQGTVHYAGYRTDLEDNIVKTELVQISKMPIEWFVPKSIDSLSWDVNKAPWKPFFKPMDRPLAKGGYRAMIDYAEAVMTDKTVFIDDIINSLVNITPSGEEQTTLVTIENIDMSNNVVAHQVEASFDIIYYKDENVLTVRYEKMPLIMSIPEGLDENETDYNSAIRFSSKLETSESWGNSKTYYSLNYSEEQVINSASSLAALNKDLYDLIYGKFQIVSNFYKNQVIDVRVNTNDIIVQDGVLTGFDANLDPSLYSVVDLSGFTDVKKIYSIAPGAFDVFKNAACKRLTKIIFPSSLGGTSEIPTDGFIPENTFENIPTIREFDFSLLKDSKNDQAMATFNKIMENSPNAFIGLSEDRAGQIYLPAGSTEDQELFGKAVANTFQIAKLPSNFTNISSLAFKQLEWESKKDSKSNWTPIWQPSQPNPAMDAKEAAQEYAKVLDRNPGIFIDDFMNAYANIIPSTVANLKQSISDVSVDVENATASFTVTFDDGTNPTTVVYNNMPFLLVKPDKYASEAHDYNCAIVFDKMTLEEIQGHDWPNETGFIVAVGGYTYEVNSFDTLEGLPATIKANVYDNIEIPSNYFKKQEVFRAVPKSPDIFKVEMGELVDVNLTGRQKLEYTTLEIPDSLQIGGKIRTIKAGAIHDLSETGCRIKQIVFPSGLEKIETDAFSNCGGIETLNFIGLGQGEFANLVVKDNAFQGLNSTTNIGKGRVAAQAMTPANLERLIITKLVQQGGLAAEWFNPETSIKQMNWDIIDPDTKEVVKFEPIFTPIEVERPSAIDYLYRINKNPLIFISDFFYTYTQKLLPEQTGYKFTKDFETISDISVKENSKLNFKVQLSIEAQPEDEASGLKPYSYEVTITYKDMFVIYNNEAKCFEFREDQLKGSDGWQIHFEGKKIIDGVETAFNEIRDKDDIATPEAKAEWAAEQPHLFYISYEGVKLYSDYYREGE